MVPRQDVDCILLKTVYHEAMKFIRSKAPTRYHSMCGGIRIISLV